MIIDCLATDCYMLFYRDLVFMNVAIYVKKEITRGGNWEL